MYQNYLEKIEKSKATLGEYLPILYKLLGACIDLTSTQDDERVFKLNEILQSEIWLNYLKISYSQKAHDESHEPKPPVFNDATKAEIERLVAIVESA